MKFRVILERDEETSAISAVCPELPGCASFGETEEEALQNIQEAIELYLEPTPQQLAAGAMERYVEARVG